MSLVAAETFACDVNINVDGVNVISVLAPIVKRGAQPQARQYQV